MKIILTDEARAELEEAMRYYERKAGLGLDVLESYEAGLKLIRDFPNAWSPVSPDKRRFLMDRFPYQIVYSQEGNDLLILGVVHTEREPRNW